MCILDRFPMNANDFRHETRWRFGRIMLTAKSRGSQILFIVTRYQWPIIREARFSAGYSCWRVKLQRRQCSLILKFKRDRDVKIESPRYRRESNSVIKRLTNILHVPRQVSWQIRLLRVWQTHVGPIVDSITDTALLHCIILRLFNV